jgi:TolA-binding protein
VDLQARIQSLEDARSQFQQILTQTTSIGDILAVEQQISDLQTQIEQLQGQLQVMANQATYSTLTVHVAEAAKKAVAPPPPPRPPSGMAKAWAHARHSFAHGVEAVVGALGGIAVFLAFAAAFLLAGRLGWIFLRRRLV